MTLKESVGPPKSWDTYLPVNISNKQSQTADKG